MLITTPLCCLVILMIILMVRTLWQRKLQLKFTNPYIETNSYKPWAVRTELYQLHATYNNWYNKTYPGQVSIPEVPGSSSKSKPTFVVVISSVMSSCNEIVKCTKHIVLYISDQIKETVMTIGQLSDSAYHSSTI